MRLLVLGAGAIGGYFGGRLAAGGADVTFLVRPARAKLLAKNGLRIESPVGDGATKVKTVTEARETFDAVLLSCKAYDLASAIDAISPAVGPDTLVIPLLNGARHYDDLDARFGCARVAGGLVQMPGQLRPDGSILHFSTMQRFVYGPREPAQKDVCERLLPVLELGGFAPVLTDEIDQAMWEKYLFIAALAGLTCLMRAPIGAIMTAADGRSIAIGFIDECAAIATAAGHAPRADALSETRELLTKEGSAHTASMLRDLREGGRTEHDHIFGDMVLRARAAGIAAPYLTLALAHMQAYEALRSDA
ncbi:ketopantoate reductase family protein [Hansschlegelia quercus]|uniref:2-dehydropantoate 2-reductase n=1 Tax=Hansschlegelia quercus TaxID=2528245 RepID=A0A4Q9GL12_9HYPH|nr:ketopantoate reductase family protein [Hansschlegelia quercus]TBN53755.1 ketopantoate reductase family protein [Hansschlegelia quercus]